MVGRRGGFLSSRHSSSLRPPLRIRRCPKKAPAGSREKRARSNRQQDLAIREIRARAFPRWGGCRQRRRFSCAAAQATRLHRERPEGFIERAKGGTRASDRLLATERIVQLVFDVFRFHSIRMWVRV